MNDRKSLTTVYGGNKEPASRSALLPRKINKVAECGNVEEVWESFCFKVGKMQRKDNVFGVLGNAVYRKERTSQSVFPFHFTVTLILH